MSEYFVFVVSEFQHVISEIFFLILLSARWNVIVIVVMSTAMRKKRKRPIQSDTDFFCQIFLMRQ